MILNHNPIFITIPGSVALITSATEPGKNESFEMRKILSNLFVIAYLGTTLLLRLIVEPQLKGYWAISLLFGVFGLLFLWALMKNRIITPTILGLDQYVKPIGSKTNPTS